MMHDPDTLASAYLDGELTDDERRIAEADPAVMAEVEQLRGLRAGLAAVDPATDATREAAIGAAMAAFHEQFTTAPATAPVPSGDADHDASDAVVIPMWQRFAGPQWLAAAAAAAVLVVGVGVMTTRMSGGDDDSADVAADDMAAATMSAEEPADESLDLPDAGSARVAESEMADEAFAAESDDAGDMDMGHDPADAPAEEPAEESAGDTADDSEMAGDAEMADEPAGDGSGVTGPPALDDPSLHFEFEVPIVGQRQLRSAGWYLLTQRADGVLGPTPEYRCEFHNVLGVALLDVEGDVREVLIEIDEIERVVHAVDRDGCIVVASVDLDEP